MRVQLKLDAKDVDKRRKDKLDSTLHAREAKYLTKVLVQVRSLSDVHCCFELQRVVPSDVRCCGETSSVVGCTEIKCICDRPMPSPTSRV
jgi:hypothetical protein